MLYNVRPVPYRARFTPYHARTVPHYRKPVDIQPASRHTRLVPYRARRPRSPEYCLSPAFCLLIAWFAAANGLRPLLTILTAAAIHECGHLLILRLCGAHVFGFRLSVLGAVLETDCARLSYGRELAAICAGPAANFLAASLFGAAGNPYPALSGANLALCAFNLLPVRPLDGGRALECAVSCAAGPAAGDRIARVISAFSAAALAIALASLMWISRGNLWLLPAAFAMAARVFQEIYR